MGTEALVGKTILSTTVMKRAGRDDAGWLKLEFADGTSCVIVASYGLHTGDSEDEYPTRIYITDDTNYIAGLIPAYVERTY